MLFFHSFLFLFFIAESSSTLTQTRENAVCCIVFLGVLEKYLNEKSVVFTHDDKR